MKKKKIISVLLIMVLALVLRIIAMNNMSCDIDEGIYIPIAKEYNEMMKNKDIGGVIVYDRNIEHPVFVKMIYAAGLGVGEKLGINIERFRNQLSTIRITALIFSMIHVLIISLINPVAGLIMALSTWEIKYSVEGMFDGISTLLASIAILSFIRAKGEENKYFLISAIAIGAAFASKYITASTAIAILPFLFWHYRKKIGFFFAYGIVAFMTFFILDPILWTDTIERLKSSIFFHGNYIHGNDVTSAAFPFYMQIVWLMQSVPWHPGAFYINIDPLLFILGIIGFPFLLKRDKILGVWFGVTFLFLIVYPTKWPQYTLIFIPPMALAGGEAINQIFQFLTGLKKKVKKV